jgi:hypothetical protein
MRAIDESIVPGQFGVGVGFGGVRPDIGRVVREARFVVGPPGEESAVADQDREPIVRIAFEDRWDPREEPLRVARKRLLARSGGIVDDELKRIVASAEAHGYEFTDTRPKQTEHLRWLFEHIAHRKSYGDIAGEQRGARDLASSVYNAIKPYAEQLGIRLSPGESS